jgi:hypothetical protein
MLSLKICVLEPVYSSTAPVFSGNEKKGVGSGRFGLGTVAVCAGAAAKASPVGFLLTVFLGATLLALTAMRCSCSCSLALFLLAVAVAVREQRNHFPDSLHAEHTETMQGTSWNAGQ